LEKIFENHPINIEIRSKQGTQVKTPKLEKKHNHQRIITMCKFIQHTQSILNPLTPSTLTSSWAQN